MKKDIKFETVQQFVARGGKINVVSPGKRGFKRSTSLPKKPDAEVMKFLPKALKNKYKI